ncbi:MULTISPECIES: hypothetical protein [Actinotignum]|nr:hypothetical protein [Actinotignum timonense]MDE1558691.1 hypothetical protein [Actinotignum schaalii]MDK6372545.1 hypothetical protein [Actinotignum timonense]MDY5130042.1 hypothetical protein [Actinotignum timonense]MDY5142390.1 hypothetical protein [Actinotignum timonense]
MLTRKSDLNGELETVLPIRFRNTKPGCTIIAMRRDTELRSFINEPRAIFQLFINPHAEGRWSGHTQREEGDGNSRE